jgi:hypothetical protein
MKEEDVMKEDLERRIDVALNPNTPADILEKLADDSDWHVRNAVASNRSTPADILKKLSEDSKEYVREAVAWNRSTPAVILERLSEDDYWPVREAVASNRSTPADILERLTKDSYFTVKSAAFYNPIRKKPKDSNPETSKYCIDYTSCDNGSYRLRRLSTEAILYTNPNLEYVFAYCYKTGINRNEVIIL